MIQATQKSKSLSTKHLRSMLEGKSTQLRAQLKNPSANVVLHASGDPYDSADWAEKSHEEWIFLQKNRFDVTLLREIEAALDRMREGTYGVCMECGLPLSRKRLEALPWARYCVSCQESRNTTDNN